VPTERNKLTELAITSNTDEKRSLVVVSHETGDKIIRARKLIEARPVTDHGRIIQINDKRNTVVYQSVRGNEVTFTLDAGGFNAMAVEEKLKLGHSSLRCGSSAANFGSRYNMPHIPELAAPTYSSESRPWVRPLN
jgi:hypothetical protein